MSGGEIAAIVAAVAALISAFRSGQAKRKADVTEIHTGEVKSKVERINGESSDTPAQH